MRASWKCFRPTDGSKMNDHTARCRCAAARPGSSSVARVKLCRASFIIPSRRLARPSAYARSASWLGEDGRGSSVTGTRRGALAAGSGSMAGGAGVRRSVTLPMASARPMPVSRAAPASSGVRRRERRAGVAATGRAVFALARERSPVRDRSWRTWGEGLDAGAVGVGNGGEPAGVEVRLAGDEPLEVGEHRARALVAVVGLDAEGAVDDGGDVGGHPGGELLHGARGLRADGDDQLAERLGMAVRGLAGERAVERRRPSDQRSARWSMSRLPRACSGDM